MMRQPAPLLDTNLAMRLLYAAFAEWTFLTRRWIFKSENEKVRAVVAALQIVCAINAVSRGW